MTRISITAHYTEVAGIRTFYETNDSAQNSVIVCLHSEGRETRQFHEVMEALAPEYRVIAFDMPAHGKTWPVNGTQPITDWTAYVDFAWKFMETMHLQDAIVMGCGLGAAVAFSLARKHPVKGIVTIGGADNTQTEINDALINHPHISTPHMMLEYNDSITGRDAGQSARELIRWQTWCEAAITTKADLQMLCTLDQRQEIGQISCPVLMLRGEDDWVSDQEMSEAAFGRLTTANKQLITFSHTGRFVMLEQPRKTARAIHNFFATSKNGGNHK